MSTSTYHYLGPYFRCETRTEPRERKIVACPNRKCDRYGKELFVRFCPSCGTKIDPAFAVTATATIPCKWEVSDAINEALTEVGYDGEFHLWIPNVERPGKAERPSELDDGEGAEVDILTIDYRGEMDWLDTAFAVERRTLIEAYGESKVSTRWSLIRYYI